MLSTQRSWWLKQLWSRFVYISSQPPIVELWLWVREFVGFAAVAEKGRMKILRGPRCTKLVRDFSGGPVVKTTYLQCKGHRFYLWSGELISHMLCGQKHKLINKSFNTLTYLRFIAVFTDYFMVCMFPSSTLLFLSEIGSIQAAALFTENEPWENFTDCVLF